MKRCLQKVLVSVSMVCWFACEDVVTPAMKICLEGSDARTLAGIRKQRWALFHESTVCMD